MTLARVGLRGKEGRRVGVMSAGEAQRVAIARAVVGGAGIVLADEPTGNLDAESAAVVRGMLGELAGEGVGVLVVTHHIGWRQECSRWWDVADGRVVAAG